MTVPGDENPKGAGRTFVEAYLLARRRDLGPNLAECVECLILDVACAMERVGLDADPRTIGLDGMVEFIKGYLGDCTDRYEYRGCLDSLQAFSKYLEFYGNFSASAAMRALLLCERPEWLPEAQVKQLLEDDMTARERVLLLLQIRMGLGPDEVCRLSLWDVSDDAGAPCLRVRGQDGKVLRSVPIAEEVKPALDEWMAERIRVVEASKKACPGWEDPRRLIIWEGEDFDARSGNVDDSLTTLCYELLDRFTDYTILSLDSDVLRKTCARAMLLAGTDPAVASRYLGMDVPKWVEETFPMPKDIDAGTLSAMVRFPELPRRSGAERCPGTSAPRRAASGSS